MGPAARNVNVGVDVLPFGDLVRQYRRAAELTQEELAERASLSLRAVSDIERGVKRRPRKDTVHLLADALGLAGAEREVFQGAARRIGEPEHLGRPRPIGWEPVGYQGNLPHEPTPFIGREGEISQLVDLLQTPTVQMVTLTGPGGIGKTRLALQIAGRLRDAFGDGVYFVSLAPLSDPNLVPAAVALALGIEEQAGQELLDALRACLRTKQLLLVLDNFEHLLPGADAVSHLLAACPQVTILVTSRAILQLAAEHEYPVPPLALPDIAHLPNLEILELYDAIAFFLERARAAKPDFTLSQENVATVAEICSRLDGLPLAIELAAARIKLFPPQTLLERLAQRLTLLTGGARDRPLRHQTLRAAIDWSYGLLDLPEQRLFARLSVFTGGCGLEAIEAVCKPEGDLEIEALDGMSSLLDKSLVRQTGEDEPRFVMLETIREYAAERLGHTGDTPMLRRHHAAYYLRWAQAAEAELYGPRRTAWLDRLEQEHDNLRAALRWAQETGEAERSLELAIALSSFWEARDHVGEGRRWFLELLAPGGSTQTLRVRALITAAWLAYSQHDFRHAHELLVQSLDLARELGDRRLMADALRRLGWIEGNQAALGRAVASLEQGLALARSIGDAALISSILCYLTWCRLGQGDAATALQLAEESLALARELGDPRAMGDALVVTIEVVGRRGELTRALALLEESMELLRRPDAYLDAEGQHRIWLLGIRARSWGKYEAAKALWQQAVTLSLQARDRGTAARFRVWLALLEREQGRYEHARVLLEESLAVFQELGDPGGAAHALVGLGDVSRDEGDTERTITFSQRSLALFRELEQVSHVGFSLHNLGVAAWQQGAYDQAERLLTEALGLMPPGGGAQEVLMSSGLVALDRRDYARAEEALSETLRLNRDQHVIWLAAANLEGIAGVAVGQGRMDRAARIFGAAAAVRSWIGTPIRPADRRRYEQHVAAVRGALDEERFTASWEEGRAMTVEQAIAYALDEMPGLAALVR